MKRAALIYIIKDNLGGAERRLTRAFDAIDTVAVDIIVWDRSHNDELIEEIRNYRLFNNSNIIRVRNPFKLSLEIFTGKYNWVCYFDCSGTIPLIPFVAKLSRANRLWIIASTVLINIDSANEKTKKRFFQFSKYANRIDCLYPSKIEYFKKMFPNIKCTPTPIPFTDNKKFVPKDKKKIIAFLGRMIPIKHPMEMAHAVYSIRDELRQQGYKVVMGGYGSLYNELKQYITNNGLTDLIETPGYIDSSSILPETSIFMSLQEYTNYPSQSLIEAISCGCWCIATNVGETELLVKPEFGELIELNIESISTSILDAIGQVDTTDYISKELEFAKQNFNIMNSASYFKDIIMGE